MLKFQKPIGHSIHSVLLKISVLLLLQFNCLTQALFFFLFCVRVSLSVACAVVSGGAQRAMESLVTALLFSCGLRLCSIKTRWVDSVRRRDCRTNLQRYFNCSKPFPMIVGNVECTDEFQFRKKEGPIPEFCVPFGESRPIVMASFFFFFLERIIVPLFLYVIQINLTHGASMTSDRRESGAY